MAQLASHALGRQATLEVCRSAAGFYLGTYVDHEPYSRESVEYWNTRKEAQDALVNGQWTQRQHF
ncbi:MAG: hypothetical protein KIT17_01150 [Rubrivivax sp.]|nr:hypothetical protein [Rubrivivax sp.]